MRTGVLAALLIALAGVFASEPAQAHRSHTRIGVGVGFSYGYPFWGSPWGPWGPWYYPPPYYYPQTIIIRSQQPTTYIEQGSPAAAEAWWYYCDASKGYYPYVKECPSGWERVPPAPPSAK